MFTLRRFFALQKILTDVCGSTESESDLSTLAQAASALLEKVGAEYGKPEGQQQQVRTKLARTRI